MSMLTGLHGTAALVLLCALLFAEESGVPLPLFPGDAILIAAGLLIANGALAPWIFLPAACLAVLGGRKAMNDRDWHYELTRDPRASTYPGDSQQWVWLKECVFEDPQASDDLLGGLDYLRCHGARIISSVKCGYRLGRGDCPGDVYEAVRSTVLT